MAEEICGGRHCEFFCNRECEYFPCHPTEEPESFNCLFCYCPLYLLGDRCGGNFRYLENGCKDCSGCLFPHVRENYGKITARYGELIKLMSHQRERQTARKEGRNMKIMTASDIHGSARFCGELLRAFDREGADRLLLLGDILYHGPRNALPEQYDPAGTAAMLNERRERILCVRGNCDSEVDQMVLEFPVMAEYCVLPWGGRLIYATHGHVFNTETPPPLCRGDVLLHGHTHVQAWESFGDGNMYFNPGSVSIPKNGTERGYMVLTEREAVWKTLDGEVLHREEI